MAIEYEKFKLPQKWFEYDYSKMLGSLLPKGLAWVHEKQSELDEVQNTIDSEDIVQNTNFSSDVVQNVTTLLGQGNKFRRMLAVFAAELARVESDAWELLNQTDPGVATYLLEDWEQQLGLPEECLTGSSLSLDQRQRAAHQKWFNASQTSTLTWYEEYAEGLGYDITVDPAPTTARRIGVARMGVERMGGGDGSDASTIQITVNSGSPLSFLQCNIEKQKPAHVVIVWT
jgi:hypothetical protein